MVTSWGEPRLPSITHQTQLWDHHTRFGSVCQWCFASNFCYLDSFTPKKQERNDDARLKQSIEICIFTMDFGFTPWKLSYPLKLMFGFRWFISLLKCSFFRLDVGSFSGGNFHWPRPRPKLTAEVCLCMGKGFSRDPRSGASRSLAGLDEIDLKPRFLVVSGKLWGFLDSNYIPSLICKDLFFLFFSSSLFMLRYAGFECFQAVLQDYTWDQLGLWILKGLSFWQVVHTEIRRHHPMVFSKGKSTYFLAKIIS